MIKGWYYQLKTLRYEQFSIPLALLPLFIIATLVVRNSQNFDNLASETGRVFIEAVLPLVAALLGSSVVLNDPALELHYTLPRPIWRTQIERLLLIIVILGLFYSLFAITVWVFGIPWIGWSDWRSGWLVWLGPTIGWMGLALVGGSLWGNSIAGNGFVAGLWIITIFSHAELYSTLPGRLIMPQLTIFDPTSQDWPFNRLFLVIFGAAAIFCALYQMQLAERFINSEK